MFWELLLVLIQNPFFDGIHQFLLGVCKVETVHHQKTEKEKINFLQFYKNNNIGNFLFESHPASTSLFSSNLSQLYTVAT